MRYLATVLFWGAALVAFLAAAPAGPNTLAVYNPKLRTQSLNGTVFIVAIDKTAVAKAVGKYPLVPVPIHDKKLFPHGFPADKHPVLVETQYQNDIRMGKLEINSLMSASVIIPYVDRLGDGKTGFLYPLAGYIGSTPNQKLGAVVPAEVGTLEGVDLLIAQITPNNAAYRTLGNGQFSSQVKRIIVPNPISGPGIVPSAIDLLFSAVTAKLQLYVARTFHTLINQAEILNNGLCQRNTVYYNATFAEPKMRTGTVTLYAGTVPKELAGVYHAQGGYSANGEMVGYDVQECKKAAAQVDPKALH